MHILFLTRYYPPEVAAPAARTYECARAWVKLGHKVSIVTTAPNHPYGKAYPGFRNRWTARERIEGVEVYRIWTYLAANRGFGRRVLSFISYPLSVFLHIRSIPRTDVVISSSPPFFAGLAGWLLRRRNRPWVFEVRDLYPESILAVGAMKRGVIVRMLERLERIAYRRADAIVSLTDSFVPHIRERRGRGSIKVIKNGVNLDLFGGDAKEAAAEFRRSHALEGKFIVTYIGTLGMAHGLDTVLEAAEALLQDTRFAFVLVGDGAELERLTETAAARGLENIKFLGQRPKEEMPAIWSASDATMVLLRRASAFETVLPSKLFEAMAMRVPIILGVAGEARALIEAAQSGIAITPESAGELVAAIQRIANDPDAARRMGQSGRSFVELQFDRSRLAASYADFLAAVVQRNRTRDLSDVPTESQ